MYKTKKEIVNLTTSFSDIKFRNIRKLIIHYAISLSDINSVKRILLTIS